MGPSSEPGRELSALVVGAGSIGHRHLANLAALGAHPLGAVDPRVERAQVALATAGAGQAFTSLDAALATRHWDVGVVATPSSLHVAPATALAAVGTHVLVEKPLSDSLDGVAQLLATVERTGVVAMMAMCYRFHPGLQRLRGHLAAGTIGRVLTARCSAGYYLPWWHPDQDYREEYAAQKRLGGGVLLASIHLVDYVRWLFGEVTEVQAVMARVGRLEIDVEDVAAGLCRTADGAIVALWLDFLQHSDTHRIEVTGEHGELTWSIAEPRLVISGPQRGAVRVEELPADGIEAMYIAEMSAFLEVAASGGQSPVPLAEGVRDLSLAEAFRRSAASGRAAAPEG